MNKKSECEQAVRSLAREWFNGLPDVGLAHQVDGSQRPCCSVS